MDDWLEDYDFSQSKSVGRCNVILFKSFSGVYVLICRVLLSFANWFNQMLISGWLCGSGTVLNTVLKFPRGLCCPKV